MRYYVFNFQDDTTLFIEDSSVDKVRDDNKLTYYQFPPDYNIQDNKGLSVSKKINGKRPCDSFFGFRWLDFVCSIPDE